MQSRHILPILFPTLALLATGCVEEAPTPNPLTDENTPADEYEFRAILDLPGREVHPPIRVEDLTVGGTEG